jgi:hypothetical protein
MASGPIAQRLAQLEGFSLSQADLELIASEFEDFDRALRELEQFAEAVPWPSLAVQPYTRAAS